MLLRVSFEALASCFALLLIVNELIFFGTYLACLSFKLPPDRAITFVYWFYASCCFELPESGRQFLPLCCQKILLLALDGILRNLRCFYCLGQVLWNIYFSKYLFQYYSVVGKLGLFRIIYALFLTLTETVFEYALCRQCGCRFYLE